MALMGEIPKRNGGIADIKQLANYVYQLEDQVRYCLSHLGSENITPGSVTGDSLAAGAIHAENLDKGIRQTFTIDNQQVISALEDMEGTLSVLRQSISGLESRVVDAETVVDGYDTRMTQAETAINQKADGIEFTALKTQVEGQQIGGTNLLPDSKKDRESTRFLSIPVKDILEPYVGDSVCVSFDILGETARSFIVYAYQSRGVSIGETHTFTMPTTEYKRFSFVTTVKDWGTGAAGTTTGAIAFYDSAGDQDYTVRNIKIELGNMPTDWSPAPQDAVESLENTSVRIDSSGVKMKGGKLDFEAGSEFNVKSGGTFKVFATDDDSVIRFGGTEQNPNFSLGARGTVKARKITAEELEVTGGGGIARMLAGSLADQVIVSDTQPSGHGILWIQPQASGGSDTLDYILGASGGEDMSGDHPSVTLTGFVRQGSALTGSTCNYGVKFAVYNYSGACWLYRMQVQIQRADGTGNTLTIFDHNYQALLEQVYVGVGDYFEVNTLSSPSAAMENITDGSSLKLIVTITKSTGTSARFEVGTPFTIRAVGSGSQGTAQACSISYIP